MRYLPALLASLGTTCWLMSATGCHSAADSSSDASAAMSAASAVAAADADAQNSSSASAPLPPLPAAPASGPSVAYRGLFVWGPEVETFTPCNSDRTYWLDGPDELLGRLEDLAIDKADKAGEAYQPIYVELHASDEGKATDGQAVDYDGIFMLRSIDRTQSSLPADCRPLPPSVSKPAASAPLKTHS